MPAVRPERPALGRSMQSLSSQWAAGASVRPAPQGGPAGVAAFTYRSIARTEEGPEVAARACPEPRYEQGQHHLGCIPMTPMASAPVHQLRRVAARHRALPVAPSDTHQAAPRAGPDGRIAPDHAPRTLTVPACPLTTVANRDGLLPRLVLPSSDPVRHLLNRTRSRADTPGASRAAQSVVTSKTATSRLSRRGPAAAEPEGATRQVPAALPAGVARPPGLCARGGGRPTIVGARGTSSWRRPAARQPR
jgi:hypothetical protein